MQASITESDSAETFSEVSFPPAQPIEEAAAQADEENATAEDDATVTEEDPGATDEQPAEDAPVEDNVIEEPAAIEDPLSGDLLNDILDQAGESVNNVQDTERAVRLNIKRANQP